MTRLRFCSISCSVSQVARRRQLRHRRVPGNERRKAEREQAEQHIGGDAAYRRPTPIRVLSSTTRNEAGGKEHAHALEIEHAHGDEVAGMDLVVVAEREPLDLLVDREAQLIGGVVADRFAKVVLRHREDAAPDRDDEQDDARSSTARRPRRRRHRGRPPAWSTACRAAPRHR